MLFKILKPTKSGFKIADDFFEFGVLLGSCKLATNLVRLFAISPMRLFLSVVRSEPVRYMIDADLR